MLGVFALQIVQGKAHSRHGWTETLSHKNHRVMSVVVFSAYRARPRDPNKDVRSDEDFCDEEFILTEADLE